MSEELEVAHGGVRNLKCKVLQFCSRQYLLNRGPSNSVPVGSSRSHCLLWSGEIKEWDPEIKTRFFDCVELSFVDSIDLFSKVFVNHFRTLVSLASKCRNGTD